MLGEQLSVEVHGIDRAGRDLIYIAEILDGRVDVRGRVAELRLLVSRDREGRLELRQSLQHLDPVRPYLRSGLREVGVGRVVDRRRRRRSTRGLGTHRTVLIRVGVPRVDDTKFVALEIEAVGIERLRNLHGEDLAGEQALQKPAR